MKKKYYLFIILSLILLSIPSSLIAQNNNQERIKNLKDSLSIAKEDTNMVRFIQELFWCGFYNNDPEIAKRDLDKALAISKTYNYLSGLCLINEDYGDVCFFTENKSLAIKHYQDSKKYYKKALIKRKIEKNDKLIARNYFSVARIYAKLGEIDSSKIFLDSANRKLKIIDNGLFYSALNYYDIATINGNYYKKNDLVISYAKKGLKILKDNSIDSCNWIGDFYYMISQGFYFNGFIDSANYYYDIKLSTLKDCGKNVEDEILFNKGQYFKNIEEYDSAKFYYNKVLQILDSTKKENYLKIAFCYSSIGLVQNAPLLKEKMTGFDIPESRFDLGISSYKLSNDFYEKEIQLSKDTTTIKYYSSLMALNHMAIGSIYSVYKNIIAINHFMNAKELYLFINDNSSKANLAECYQQMGNFYGGAEKHDLSIEYYKEASVVYHELYIIDTSNIQMKQNLAKIYTLIATQYDLIALGEHLENDFSFNKNEKINNGFYESAVNYQKALVLYSALQDTTNMAICYMELGSILNYIKKYSDAISSFKCSIKMFEATDFKALPPSYGPIFSNIHFLIAKIYGNIGNSYYELKDYNASVVNLKLAIEQYENNIIKSDDSLFDDYLGLFDMLYLNYSALNDYANTYNCLKKELSIYENTGKNIKGQNKINEIKVIMEIVLYQMAPDKEKYLINTWDNPAKISEIEYLTAYYMNILQNEKDTLYSIVAYNFVAILDLLKGDIVGAKSILNKLTKIPSSISNETYMQMFLGLGKIYYILGEYKISYDILNNMLFSINKLALSDNMDFFDLAEYYLYYGKDIKELGDPQNSIYSFKKSADNYSKSLSTVQTNKDTNDILKRLSECYFEIASIYNHVGKNDSSIFYYNLAYEQSFKIADSNDISMIYTNLGIMCCDNGQNNVADSLLKLAREYNSKKCDQCYVHNLVTNARILIKNKNYSDAKSTLDFAQMIIDTIIKNDKIFVVDLSDEKYSTLSSVYNAYGYLYEEQKKYDVALNYYQKALNVISSSNDTSIYSNPEMKNFPIDKAGIIILLNKAKCLNEYFVNITHSSKDNQMALNTSLLASGMIDKVRNFYKDDDLKLLIGTDFNNFYKTSENIAHEAGDIDNSFYFTEKSKAQVLQFIINESEAKKTCEIPDDLLRKENQLKYKLIYCKDNYKVVYNGKTLQDTLFILNREYQNFIGTLEKDFPNYYNLKYSGAIVPLDTLRSKLDNSTAMIEYFIGDSTLTMFCITHDTSIIYQSDISKDSLIKLTMDYKGNIKSVGFNENIDILANNLYKILLKPFEIYFKDYSLIIIPDGPLMEIPFEPFLTNLDTLKMTPYLIRHNPVSYHYSATLWCQTRDRYFKKQHSMDQYAFLGFAPFGNFKKDYKSSQTSSGCANLSGLDVTDDEIKSIATFYYNNEPNKYCHIDSLATKEEFIKQCKEFRYIDLPTHGCTENINNPYLQFYTPKNKKDLTDDGRLEMEDVFNLYPMKADLLTLTACQSGLGENIPGEGMISLVRGFLYAGVSNITYSLFNIKSGYSKEIMVNFYSEINKQKGEISYSRAMQLAKIRLMDDQKQDVTPIDWSPIILMGVN